MTTTINVEESASIDGSPAESNHGANWRSALGFTNISAVYLLVLVIVVFSIWAPDTFLTTDTLRQIVNQNAVSAIVALALVVPLSAHTFDLSVGAVVTLSAATVAYLLVNTTIPVPLVVAAALGAAIIVGLVNAFFVVTLRVESLIATLASGALLEAVAVMITDEKVITGSRLFGPFGDLAITDLFGVTLPVFIALAIALVLWWLMDHTATGRRIYATGFNEKAARLSGVRTRQLRFIALIVSAFIASVAGVVLVSQVSSASPGIGSPYLLNAFAAAFLGASQLRGGRFNAFGTLLAVCLLATGQVGLGLVDAPVWAPSVFTGVVLLAALALRSARTRSP